MITLLLKLGFRTFKSYKFQGLINIGGLTIGVLSFVMIMLYVSHEKSYDNFHSNGKRIYRLISHASARSAAITPYVWGQFFQHDLADVEQYTTLQPLTLTVKDEEDVNSESRIMVVDSTFFEIFDFPIIKGNNGRLLRDPNRMVITPETALRYFGQADPIGQSLEINVFGNFITYEVEAIAQSPENSHIQFDFLLPVKYFKIYSRDTIAYRSWSTHFVFTYLKLSKDADITKMRDQFKAQLGKHAGVKVQESYTPDVEPLMDIYLKSGLTFDFAPRGDNANVNILSLVAACILIMAIINFINITTAQSLKRIKEVGVRKIFGSSRRLFILQFIGESTIATFIAVVLSAILLYILLPYYNEFTEKHFAPHSVYSYANLVKLVALALLVGILAGIYPAILLSSYRPINILRSRSGARGQGTHARKVLVTMQFCMAVVLLTSTGVIFKQVDYMRSVDPGFNKNNIIVIEDGGEISSDAVRTDRLRQELLKANLIKSLSASSTYPGQQTWAMRFLPDGFEGEEALSISTVFADQDYIKTYEINISQGRDFERQWPADSSSLLLNQRAIELFASRNPDWNTNPLEHKVSWVGFGGTSGKSPVLGIFKNFNFESLRSDINPLIIRIEPLFFSVIQLKLAGNANDDTIKSIEQTWKKLFPEAPFAYKFVTDQFSKYSLADQQLGKTLRLFSILSILIAVLGLFGLATFMTEEKSREMSIRKITGATERQIVGMLSWMFLKLVLLANLLAFPICFFLLSNWLQDFAFRIPMPYTIFIFATMTTASVSLLTIIYHAMKTANINPVVILSRE